jgi:hypothetical protein
MRIDFPGYEIIAFAVLSPFCGFAADESRATVSIAAAPVCGQMGASDAAPEVELGKVGWGSDFFNAITPLKATRMHADVANRASFLSPRQDALRERIEALFEGLDRDQHQALLKKMQQDLNPSQYRNLCKMTLTDYHEMLIGYLEKL